MATNAGSRKSASLHNSASPRYAAPFLPKSHCLRIRTRCAAHEGLSASVVSVLASASVSFLVCWSCPEAWATGVYDASGSPYQLANSIALGPTEDGYIRACPSGINPNCVSTSSNNDTYAPAWRSREKTLAQTVEAVDVAMLRLHPEVQLVQSRSYPSAEFRAYEIQGLWGSDIVEFMFKSDAVGRDSGSNVSSSSTPETLVLYRSLAGTVKYVYPFTQPVTDFDLQRKHVSELREALGWPMLGCDFIECYEGS